MAGIGSEESPTGRPSEGVSTMHRSPSVDALAEWRSSEQVENGIPSTVPSYWESDDEEGVKPCELYGKHTWRIEKFSQINKRELRSNVFEVGGYSWYILIYPQGCDVCNHLSLFLCVANHDKLLPGWSHFAQFTIAVVNKDPKKSKYSDTLHRFWKKEHDWGWKKFMELSKLFDGFIDGDTLTIKAQVQVIREKADRPFRCLDCQYRRELVRVYLTNVEQLCRRFVEEKRGKLGKLIEDKAKWSSFRAFWLAIDQDMRHAMSRERSDLILKIIVKHFFIEKEVTSTLVMDSLYSGLKSLEGQSSMCSKGKLKLLDTEELAASFVYIDKDMFVLVDDILVLLERAAIQPLPPKEEKAPQNRTKDGGSGDDINKDSVERDERRLTELGRRTVETFVLTHIFSNKIEVAYQEAIALKRQEELIREEEEAWLAECEQKAKRGASEKKSKKKQAKKKGNNRKGRGRMERDLPIVVDLPDEKATLGPEISDDVSDVSDSVSCMAEPLQLDCERDAISPSSQLKIHENKSLSAMDDSSSTCSTDSAPSVLTNGALEAKRKVSKSPGFTVSEPEKRTPTRSTSRCVNSNEPSKSENKILAFTPKASCSLASRASPTLHEPKPDTRKAPLSRPSSAPIIPAPIPAAIPTVQTAPSLTRSTSTSARSYRNAIMGTMPTAIARPSNADNRKKLDPCLEQPGSSTSIQNGITKAPSPVVDHHFTADSPAGTSGRQIETCPADEFPHLDIINDLLDDDQVPDIFTSKRESHQSLNHVYLNRLFSGLSMGPADGLAHGYGLFEFPKQAGLFTYPNRQVDGLVGGGWVPGPNPFGIRSLEGDGVPENVPNYANGYSVFRPSNGR